LVTEPCSWPIQPNTRTDVQEQGQEVTLEHWKPYSGKQEICGRTEEMEMDMLWRQHFQLTEETVMGIFNISCIKLSCITISVLQNW